MIKNGRYINCKILFKNRITYSFTIILNTSLSFSQIRKSAKFRKMNEGANGTLNYSSKFAGKVLLHKHQYLFYFISKFVCGCE